MGQKLTSWFANISGGERTINPTIIGGATTPNNSESNFWPLKINAFGELMTAGSVGVSAGSSVYSNLQGNFVANATPSTKVISITGSSFVLTSQSLAAGNVKRISSLGAVDNIPLSNIIVNAGAATLSDMAANFNTDDMIIVNIVGPDKAYDTALDINKVIEQAPLWGRYADVETVISTPQTMSSAWADVGPEIDVRGYNYVTFWTSYQWGFWRNFRLRCMVKHTLGGTEEYNIPVYSITGSGRFYNPVTITSSEVGDYVCFPTTSNSSSLSLFVTSWETYNLYPYLQLQAMADSGASILPSMSAISASYVTKGYK